MMDHTLNLLEYLIKVHVCLVVLYGLYHFLFRNQTFFQVNRFVLLASLVLACVLPFSIHWHSAGPVLYTFTLTTIPEVLPNQAVVDTPAVTTVSIIVTTLSSIYLLGSLVFLMRLLFLSYKLFKAFRGSHHINQNQYTQLKGFQANTGSFSFFRWIYIDPQLSAQESEKVLQHELVHVSQRHSIDLLLAEAIGLILWCNPVYWLTVKRLKETHEFIADQQSTNHENHQEVVDYMELLTRTAWGESSMQYTHPFFNQSILKRRIMMLQKTPSNPLHLIKYTLLIPTVLGLAFLTTSNLAQAQEPVVDVPQRIEKQVDPNDDLVKAEYPGGMSAMMEFLGQEIKYPAKAKEDKTEGKAIISFIISATGKIEDVKVSKSLSPECDAEAMRVIKAMPDWKPASKDGKPVKMQMMLPIMFMLTKP